MIVCSCHRVNDRQIRRLAEDGAETLEAVGDRCGAGTGCGGCVGHIEEILEGVQATKTAVARAGRACSNPRLPVLAGQAG